MIDPQTRLPRDNTTAKTYSTFSPVEIDDHEQASHHITDYVSFELLLLILFQLIASR
jgi:hypothetical protein